MSHLSESGTKFLLVEGKFRGKYPSFKGRETSSSGKEVKGTNSRENALLSKCHCSVFRWRSGNGRFRLNGLRSLLGIETIAEDRDAAYSLMAKWPEEPVRD
jgi:hypothetical protein